MDTHAFLVALTIVLCTAGVTTVLCHWLRQPVVFGYILAGLIVGPHVPIPIVADREVVTVLSELGIIFLMFSLGLEFNLRKIIQVAPTAGITAVIETSIMVWIGFMIGQSLGWSARESVFAGAAIAISSTTIVVKAFDERNIGGNLREFVIGILIVEDLIAILMMAVLTALSSGHDVSFGTFASSGGRLAVFLVVLVAAGMLVIPRMIRMINRLNSAETTLVAAVGVCFAVALLAKEYGYSTALGAFIGGSLVAESGEERSVRRLILPVRDMFVAIFFVSVGMLIDPAVIARHWTVVALLASVVIAGKFFGVSLGAFLTGNGPRISVQAGMSMTQIGEFSFIIVGLGIAPAATREFLYPIVVAVSAMTTLTTPWLIRSGGPVAAFIDRMMPRPLQTFAALYGTWLERLRTTPRSRTTAARVARLSGLLLLDVALLAAVVVGVATLMHAIVDSAAFNLGVSTTVAGTLVVLGSSALAAPLMIGIFRIIRGLGISIAQAALPEEGGGTMDLAAAPRRALVVTIQLVVVLVVALPLMVLAQPFLPGWIAVAGLGSLLVVLAVLFWRSAVNLQGHVRAGAEIIVDALVTHARKGGGTSEREVFTKVTRLMPGIGDPTPLRLDDQFAAVGKTLAQINLRGATGVSVLAIARGREGVIVPTAGEVLRAGDVLALAGTRDAIDAATNLLRSGSDGLERNSLP